jgi:Domain of unknown function (DUF4129)
MMAIDSAFRGPVVHVVPVVPTILFILLLSCGLAAAAPSLTVPEYVAFLGRVESAVQHAPDAEGEIRQLLAGLPPEWTIVAANRSVVIASETLRRDLESFELHQTPAAKRGLLERLRLAREGAAAFQPSPADAAEIRTRLETILAGPEFRAIHGPTWLDRLQQGVLRFFERFIHLHASSFPALANVLIYGLVGLAAALVIVWMYRTMERRVPENVDLGFSGIEGRERKRWNGWLADARAEADGGHWRDAIRLAYWCGIAFLEAKGTWRPDNSRTPREYLRALPASSEYTPPLQALTRLLEHVWYGRAPADASAFDEALAHLDRLGCPTH